MYSQSWAELRWGRALWGGPGSMKACSGMIYRPAGKSEPSDPARCWMSAGHLPILQRRKQRLEKKHDLPKASKTPIGSGTSPKFTLPALLPPPSCSAVPQLSLQPLLQTPSHLHINWGLPFLLDLFNLFHHPKKQDLFSLKWKGNPIEFLCCLLFFVIANMSFRVI